MSEVAELLGCIRRGDTEAVENLLAANPALANSRDDRGNSPLLIATYTGRSEIARVLLERGARPNFFEACAVGLAPDVRRHLREDPGAVRQWAHDGWTPLHLAAFFGHREVAEALLDAAADVRALSQNAEANLPINAAAAGPRADRRPEVVRLLLDCGSPVDGRGSPSAHTPLHEAAYNGDVALVRLLLERGADRSLRTGDGQTPLEIATQQGRHEIVRLLGGPMAGGVVELVERRPSVDEYCRLVAAVGWRPRDFEAVSRALAGSLFSVCAEVNGALVGMGRVIGDGGLHYYLTDVVVDPAHQRRGIGSRIVEALTKHVERVPFKNTWVGVFAVEGTAGFYARFGYTAQGPSGPAMSRWLNKT